MGMMLGKRIAALGCLFLIFFWETLSRFFLQQESCASCYQEESTSFLLLAPPLLMIWLFRHHLFIGSARQEKPTPTQDRLL
jgi:hypothetical protein